MTQGAPCPENRQKLTGMSAHTGELTVRYSPLLLNLDSEGYLAEVGIASSLTTRRQCWRSYWMDSWFAGYLVTSAWTHRSLVRGRWYYCGVKPFLFCSYCESGVYLGYSFLLSPSTGAPIQCFFQHKLAGRRENSRAATIFDDPGRAAGRF